MAVAVVTGSNKGIGLAVVRGLCKQFKGAVYLTSRDEGRGQEAVKGLEAEGLKPSFHQLDVGDQASVERLRDYMKAKYGGIDILVNNAGIAFKGSATEPFGEQATVTLKTNYWDNKRACEILFPILKPGARVVNVSSYAGYLGLLDKATNKERAASNKALLSKPDLTVPEIDKLMKEFEESAQDGSHGDHGFHNSAYSMSKVGWSALSRVQQRQLAKDVSKDIVLNHIHPGWVRTDMAGPKAALDVDRGAQSSLYAALLPPNTDIRGLYIWDDNRVVDWVNGPLPQSG